MPSRPPLLRSAALAFFLLLVTHANAPAQDRINPPDTDFSAYAEKYPWRFTAPQLAALAAQNAPNNVDETKVGPVTLPDPFTLVDGTKVTTAGTWTDRRRTELLGLFRREVYGLAPPAPALDFRVLETDPHALSDRATLKRVVISFRLGAETFAFPLTLFVPNRRSQPAPVFLLLNHRAPANTDPTRQTRSEFWPAEYAVDRGYAIAAINVADDVEPDQRHATTGVRAFYRRHADASGKLTWGALAAWAWAGSRAIDYVATDPGLDAARIAVLGHSRGGKAALWAAAQDTRIALACINCAGEAGPALSRRNFGETLRQITITFPYWFAPNYATYADRVEALPIDQHELVALVAPRGYHGADASLDLHADPRGSWLALAAAAPVWSLLGRDVALPDEMPPVNDLLIAGPVAYHLRAGVHALTTFDWKLYLDHADRLFAPRRESPSGATHPK